MIDRKKLINELEILKRCNTRNCIDCEFCIKKPGKLSMCMLRESIDIYDDIIIFLKEQPEIVPCKDCKLNIGTPHNPMCKKDCNSHESNWFCADGERKSDDA